MIHFDHILKHLARCYTASCTSVVDGQDPCSSTYIQDDTGLYTYSSEILAYCSVWQVTLTISSLNQPQVLMR